MQGATENSILIKDNLEFCMTEVKLATVVCPTAPRNLRKIKKKCDQSD